MTFMIKHSLIISVDLKELEAEPMTMNQFSITFTIP